MTISINFTLFLTDPDLSRYDHMKTTSDEPFFSPFSLICLIGWHVLFVPGFSPAFPQHFRLSAGAGEGKVISFRPGQELPHQPVFYRHPTCYLLPPRSLQHAGVLFSAENQSLGWKVSVGRAWKGSTALVLAVTDFLCCARMGSFWFYRNELLGKAL